MIEQQQQTRRITDMTKRGRPELPEEERRIKIHPRVDPLTRDKLAELAETYNLSQSVILDKLVSKAERILGKPG